LTNPRLVVFDVEGVLLPKRRYLLFEASEKLGFWNFLKILSTGLLYEIGLMSLEKALRRIFLLLYGLTVNELLQLYKKIPIISGTTETFAKLKRAECKTALISSGLPQPFVEDLASRLNADYAYGLELKTEKDRLTGEISGDVIKHNGKALVLERILNKESIKPRDCALVADDRNNLPMFRLCALRIGYNPDFLLSAKSDVVVKGDLSEVLPFLKQDRRGIKRAGISKRTLIREIIHVSGFFIPLISSHILTPYLAAFLIFLTTLVYAASEFARIKGINFPVTSTITRNAATSPEIHEFVTAPIFFALGIALALILFPQPISYASVSIAALGDGFAALFGKTLGRNIIPFNRGKHLEGSLLGFSIAFLGASLYVTPLKALVAAALGMLVEAVPLPISDNLTVPLASGLMLLALP